MSTAQPKAPAGRRERGVTLVELLVAAGMASVIIAGAISLFLAQHRAFQAGAGDRAIQEAARVALEEVAGNLRLAGYGVDQAVTFDFGTTTVLRLENSPPTGTLAPGEPLGAAVTALAPADCPNPVTCRDSITASDELVFRYRNPYYGPHALTGVSSSALAIQGGRTDLAPGQELLVICYGAEPREWAYLTVDAPGSTNVSLRQGTGAQRDFPRQNGLLSHTCFTRPGADAPRVFRVERLRYFIQLWTENGVLRPYLMVSRGQGGAAEPVAPDVEDLQVAYVFPFIEGRNGAGGAGPDLPERIAGATASTQLANATNSIDLTAATTTSVSAFPTQAEARLLVGDAADPATSTLANRTPSNIRAVRLSLVVRSAQPDSPVATALPASLNRPAGTPVVDTRYRRFLVETTVFLNNMTNVHSYAPYYRAISTAPGSLVGGG
jgi:type IV pilus assembly protein PilW